MLSKEYGWTFLRWANVPKKEDPDKFVQMEFEVKSLFGKTWKYKVVEVGVNPWKGYVKDKSAYIKK